MKTIFLLILVGGVFLIINPDYFSKMSSRELNAFVEGGIGGAAIGIIAAILGIIYYFIRKLITKAKEKYKNTNSHEDDIVFKQITEELKTKNINEALMTKLLMQKKGKIDKAEAEYIRVRRIEITEQKKKEKILKEEKERRKKNNGGCLVFVLLIVGVGLLIIISNA